MIKAQGTVLNGYGIHCRPATMIVKAFQNYPGTIDILNQHGTRGSAKSAISILSLGLSKGTSFSIEVEGPDEQEIAQQLLEFLQKEYDFKK